MTTLQYSYAIVNENFVEILPNSAISVHLSPLRYEEFSERLVKWAIWAETQRANLKVT